MPKFAWPPNFSTLLDLTIISQISNNSVFRAFTIRPKRPPSPGSTITTNRWRREFSHITVGCRRHHLRHLRHPHPCHLHLQWKITINWYTFQLLTRKLSPPKSSLPGAMPAVEKNYWRLPSGPAWAWWILAILPLDTQAQVNICSCSCVIVIVSVIVFVLVIVFVTVLVSVFVIVYENITWISWNSCSNKF